MVSYLVLLKLIILEESFVALPETIIWNELTNDLKCGHLDLDSQQFCSEGSALK